MSRRNSTLVSIFVAIVLLVSACGSSDDGGGASTDAEGSSTATSATIVPLDGLSESAVIASAVAYGEAVLGGDIGTLYGLMSARCQAKFTSEEVEVAFALVVAAMEKQQNVTVDQVEVRGALVGAVDADGTAEAALLLNREVFADSEFAFLEMQPYVYEEGEWRFDACNLGDIMNSAGLERPERPERPDQPEPPETPVQTTNR